MLPARNWLNLSCSMGLLALMVIGWASASAHGVGTPQLINATAGPYLISVWTDPDPLRVDEMHVVVAVMDPDTMAPLLEDITVFVTMDSSTAPPSLVSRPATAEDSENRLFYTAVFDGALAEGEWTTTVTVEGPLGGSKSPSFLVDVTTGNAPNWLLIGGAGIGLLLLVWFVVGRRQSASETTTDQPPKNH